MDLETILTVEQIIMPVIVLAFTGVAWGIRLEGKVSQNAKDINSMETRNGARLSRIEEKIDGMAKDLNRAIGRMDMNNGGNKDDKS